ncbi:MAG TPA: hypothetical protein VGL76_06530 [Gaiellaceae bacterium]
MRAASAATIASGTNASQCSYANVSRTISQSDGQSRPKWCNSPETPSVGSVTGRCLVAHQIRHGRFAAYARSDAPATAGHTDRQRRMVASSSPTAKELIINNPSCFVAIVAAAKAT